MKTHYFCFCLMVFLFSQSSAQNCTISQPSFSDIGSNSDVLVGEVEGGQNFLACGSGVITSVSFNIESVSTSGNTVLTVSTGENTNSAQHSQTLFLSNSFSGILEIQLNTAFPVTSGQRYAISLGEEGFPARFMMKSTQSDILPNSNAFAWGGQQTIVDLAFSVNIIGSNGGGSSNCDANVRFETPGNCMNGINQSNAVSAPVAGGDMYIKVEPRTPNDIDWIELYADDRLIRRENTYPFEWCRPNQGGDNYLRNLSSKTYYLSVKVKSKCDDMEEITCAVEVGGNGINGENDCQYEFEFEQPVNCANASTPNANRFFDLPISNNTYSNNNNLYVKVTPVKHQDIDWMELYLDDQLIRRENSYPFEWCRPDQGGDPRLRNLSPGTYQLRVYVKDKCGNYHEKYCSATIGNAGDNGNNSGNSAICQPQCSFKSLGIHGVDLQSISPGFSPSSGLDFYLGNELYVHVEPEKRGDIDYMELYFDNQHIRRESQYPFEWCSPNQNNDNYLRNLQIGEYTLRVVIKDKCGLETYLTTEVRIKEIPFTTDCPGALCWFQYIANVHYEPSISPIQEDVEVPVGTDLYINVNSLRYQDIDYLELTVNSQLIGRESSYPYEWCPPNQNNHNYLRNLQPGTYNLELKIADKCGETHILEQRVHVNNRNGSNGSGGNNGNPTNCESGARIENLGLPGIDIDILSIGSEILLPYGTEIYVKVTPLNQNHISYLDLYVDGQFVRKESSYPYEWCKPYQNNDNYLRNLEVGEYTIHVDIIDKCGNTSRIEKQFRIDSAIGLTGGECSSICVFEQIANVNMVEQGTALSNEISVDMPAGNDLYIKVTAIQYQRIQSMELTVDNQFIGKEEQAPFEWCRPNRNDHPSLRNMEVGIHTAQVHITFDCGETLDLQATITIN